MKKILYIIVLLPIFVMAQSTDQNWVKSKTYKVPTTNSIATPTASEAMVQVNYYDGLGRAIQQVAHQQSNTGKDIVTHFEYDTSGRQIKEFLPHVNQSTSLNYNASAATDVLSYYNTSIYENTQNPYSEKLLENSPLDKVIKQSAPGEAWKLTSGHEIKLDYQTNALNDVKLYKATATWNATLGVYDIAFVDAGHYAINELYKTVTYDENSPGGSSKIGRTEEFKNKGGQVVLKRTFNGNDAYETFYIYDQFGNLTYVLPPLVTNAAAQLDDLCYQYKYDNHNRLVEKKLPGKQWEYIVYDKLDRVVATGPAFNPYGNGTSGWLITKYDLFNRPVYTAWHNAPVAVTADRKSLQNSYNNATVFSEVKTTSNNTIDTIITKYSNSVSPSTFVLLTVNYYDNYDFPNSPTIPSTLPDSTLPIVSIVKGMPTGSWVRVLDSAGSTTNELSYSFYDSKFRPVHSYSKNHLGGYTQVDSKLDWAGKTQYTITKHRRASSGIGVMTKDSFEYSNQDRLIKHYHEINSGQAQLLTLTTYDELGQLTNKKVGGDDLSGANAFQKVDYAYNIRGWLKSINDVSNLNPSTTENDLFAFKINYNDYNSLGANDTASRALFNGNISSTYWVTESDNTIRKYNYQYDNLNRLLEASYRKPTAATVLDNYMEKLSYDKNGNILTLERNGNVDTSSGTIANEIDDLVYTYDTNKKNQLLKVDDVSNSPQGFKDNYISQSNDYTYDGNGNMITDVNKDITEIKYNHLNLPTKINFQGAINGNISYIYNAVGQKVKKIVNDGVAVNTEYLSGYQYENAILQFFPHAEGYVKASASIGRNGNVEFYSFNYVFNYTDHLGNVRLSYALDPQDFEGLKILEENHYYAFGMKHQNYNVEVLDFISFPETGVEIIPTDNPMYKYKFNSKEYQDELELNTYSYGWRNYDASLCRFNRLDRFSEKYFELSPYGYAANSPILYNDIQGDSIGIGRDIYDKYMNGLIKRRDDILNSQTNRLNKLRAKGKFDKAKSEEDMFNKENKDIASVIYNIEATIAELKEIEEDDKLLVDFYESSKNFVPVDNAFGQVVYDNDRESLNLTMYGNYSQGNMAHEVKHVYQFLKGEMSYYYIPELNKTTVGSLYDGSDETAAYNRGKYLGANSASTLEIQQGYNLDQKSKTINNTNVSPMKTIRYGNDGKLYNAKHIYNGK